MRGLHVDLTSKALQSDLGNSIVWNVFAHRLPWGFLGSARWSRGFLGAVFLAPLVSFVGILGTLLASLGVPS